MHHSAVYQASVLLAAKAKVAHVLFVVVIVLQIGVAPFLLAEVEFLNLLPREMGHSVLVGLGQLIYPGVDDLKCYFCGRCRALWLFYRGTASER